MSAAAATQLFVPGFGPLKTELVQKSALAVALLLGITILGIYKPLGIDCLRTSQTTEGSRRRIFVFSRWHPPVSEPRS